jgi:hypothetical protein
MRTTFLLEGLKGKVFLRDLVLSRWESNVDTGATEVGREGECCLHLVHVVVN